MSNFPSRCSTQNRCRGNSGTGNAGNRHPAPPPQAPGAFAYVPAPVMMQVPMYQQLPSAPEPATTYITNYVYHQTETTVTEPVVVVKDNNVINWVPTTPTAAPALSHRAYVAGKEGWDGSPLWIIRAHHSGDFVPGKLAVKHRAAYIPHSGKEIPVHNFEVLCAPAHKVRWLPASNGQIPVGGIPAGNTHNAEHLYIGRVNHLKSVTPGKIHPSHGCCYISFGGEEIPYKTYEVLCKIVG